ncbi:MAG: hypothetical protein BGO40_06995 [Chryseobacterium sp. 39-10]|nr:MAG: hypothetical protein BGO40_06995 [Chryseobacterium sp. 39-10]
MKKFLFSVATIFAANFSFGQIELEHSFELDQAVLNYSDSQDLKYVSLKESQITIYNSDYSIYKTFNIQIPTGYNRIYLSSYDDFPFNVSKYVFNNDNKLEFFLFLDGDYPTKKVMIFNEDGNIIKDFNGNYQYELVTVYHDNIQNKNKLKMGRNDDAGKITFDIYNLPTTELSSKEIQRKNKLSAFPIPTNKILNIINPENGTNKIEIFDTSGKLVLNKSFLSSENKISVDIENLPKGIYVYKIGDLSSKFIKN